MALFLISYDFHRVKKYERLYEVLETKWKAKRLLESLWLAELKGPASEILRLLRAVIDSDDSLVVIELRGNFDWHTIRARPPGVALLRKYSP